MAVFRVEKSRDYTVMSNHHLRNTDLSLKSKGLLSQMLSLPEEWDYTLKGLSQINREGIDAIREAIRELERAGYVTRTRVRLARSEATKEALREYGAKEQAENTFTIYQLKDDVPVDYHFRSVERLQEKGLAVDPANYEKIYDAPLTPGMSLERIFEKFNFDRPEDFKGHSLSVSDVVVLHQNGQDTAHYTDSIGFVDISENFLLENPLKAAELSTEQNANMIDGIINNTPNTDALEAKANAGEQISLADLADAIAKDREAANAEPDTARITAAAKTRYEGMTALYTMDDKIYIGKSENYDNKGHYDNSDNSLLYVSDCHAAFKGLNLQTPQISRNDGMWGITTICTILKNDCAIIGLNQQALMYQAVALIWFTYGSK